jgi:hypothetical protein
MFDRVLPKSIDNAYHGQTLALWLLGLLTLMKLVIGVNSIFNGYVVMTTADGLALNTYPAAAAQNLVALWRFSASLTSCSVCCACSSSFAIAAWFPSCLRCSYCST